MGECALPDCSWEASKIPHSWHLTKGKRCQCDLNMVTRWPKDLKKVTRAKKEVHCQMGRYRWQNLMILERMSSL